MKPIKLIIIGLFVFSGILSALLYQQKSNRIDAQIEKRNLGWNPVSIKKIVISKVGKDSVVLSKRDGIWKTDKQFDGMGVAPQIINYLSTMQIKAASVTNSIEMSNEIVLKTFDKQGSIINTIILFPESKTGESLAQIDQKMPFVTITNTHNNISIWKLVEKLLSEN